MKIWSVRFHGIWPVGAVAVVALDDEDSNTVVAEERLRVFLKDAYPSLNPDPIEATLLDLQPGAVYVLLDGDY